MNQNLKQAHRILIIGDAGRGKTTFAEKLSSTLSIPHYSTDDFYWKVKFSERNKKGNSLKKILPFYEKKEWIIEGSSTFLWKPGLEKADIIINLKFHNIFSQWKSLIKRSYGRNYESLSNLLQLLVYVFRKKYNIGYKNKITDKELLLTYKDKMTTLYSHKEIDDFISKE